jgi:hypothetical protein
MHNKKPYAEAIIFFAILALFLFAMQSFAFWGSNSIQSEECIEILDEYVKITVYHPVQSQTSKSMITANGTKLIPGKLPKSVAISRDLEHKFSMEDSISIYCNCPYEGKYLINDRLGKNATMQVDILTENVPDMYYGEIRKEIKR